MDHNTLNQILDDSDSDALAAEITRLSQVIAAGEAAKTLRARAFREAHRADPDLWTQTWLADKAGISQAAVSKAVLRKPGEDSIEHSTDPAYLVGRLLGVANRIGQSSAGSSARPLERLTDRLIQEKLPVTPTTLKDLRRLIEAKLSSTYYRATYQHVLADIDERMPELPTLPTDNKTRVSLLLGYDHQRAQLTPGPTIPA